MRLGKIIIAVALALSPVSCRDRDPATARTYRTILSVCEGGGGLSVIAAAHFDELARGAGLDYRAQFRRVGEVEAALPEAIQSGLAADGLSTTPMMSATLSDQDLEAAEHIIVLDAALPEEDRFASKVIQWNGIPSSGEDFAAARDDIRGSGRAPRAADRAALALTHRRSRHVQ